MTIWKATFDGITIEGIKRVEIKRRPLNDVVRSAAGVKPGTEVVSVEIFCDRGANPNGPKQDVTGRLSLVGDDNMEVDSEVWLRARLPRSFGPKAKFEAFTFRAVSERPDGKA